MVAVSIVIITKSIADIVDGCIDKARLITDDIVIIESENNSRCTHHLFWQGCKLYQENWDGYAANKNKGLEFAKYNWILSIDSDEVPDDELIGALHNLDYSDPAVVYDIKFTPHFGGKAIRFGSWGRDHHIRLFNRKLVKWSDSMVHEKLVWASDIKTKKIPKGRLHHYTTKDAIEYANKEYHYARLSAKKYFKSGKKINFVNLYISPVFGFLRNYIFYLGFLDGREGWDIAKTRFKYTRLKYLFLRQIETTAHTKKIVSDEPVMQFQ